jgi:Ca2+-binding RTX toxin-like protein
MGRPAQVLVSGLVGAVGLTAWTLPPTAVQASNSVVTVDSAGDVGDYPSLVLDGAGNPVVSYRDLGNGDLKLLHCNEANCDGGDESVVAVDTAGDVGVATSLALDGAGNPVVSYYDRTSVDLKLLHCNDPNCADDDESIITVDSEGEVGHDPTWFPSLDLVLDAAGNPVVSYHHWDSSLDLKLLHCNDPNCADDDESIITVDSEGDVGRVSSLKLDGAGNAVVSYYDWGNGDLKLLHCNDPNCADGDESIRTLDSEGDVGFDPSLALDAADNPVVSYWDYDNDALKLLHCNDPDCAGADDSILTVDSEGDVGEYSSLVLNAAGNPVISYYDYVNFDLKLVYCNDANCAGDDDSILAVDTAGDVGENSSLVLDAGGNPVISYQDYDNGDLKVAHCDTLGCGVDGTPPVASIALSPAAPDGGNGLYRSPVRVAVTATDDNHVTGIRCALDPIQPPQSFDDLPDRPCPPFTVTKHGGHRVYAAAVDQAGNAGPMVHAAFTSIGALRCQGHLPTRIGTPGDDLIVGTPGDDVIIGLGGHDTIRGRQGNDLVCAGAGHDTIGSGPGNDHVDGGVGADTTTYATAPSAVNADLTTNRASGGAGRDRFVAVERLIGSRFADTLTGNIRANTLRGGGGNDHLYGRAGNDRLLGEAGNDALNGGASLDRGDGGIGTDTQVRCEVITRIP